MCFARPAVGSRQLGIGESSGCAPLRRLPAARKLSQVAVARPGHDQGEAAGAGSPPATSAAEACPDDHDWCGSQVTTPTGLGSQRNA